MTCIQTGYHMQKPTVLLILCLALNASGAQFALQSGTNRTTLLELYTSEGCSSCPPAEVWLSRLKSEPRLWKDFVPVAFHVDYWDDLGWRDPLGAAEYSERQRAYAAQWQSRSVYTPGFVLGGKEWRGWSIHDGPPPPSNRLTGKLMADSNDGKRWELHFAPLTETPSTVDFQAALLGFDLSSKVSAGENRGRNLQHDFVVLTLATVKTTKVKGSFQVGLSLASPPRVSTRRLAVAFWVAPHGDLLPLQAVGGWLWPTNQ
jgi:hypothetical protein